MIPLLVPLFPGEWAPYGAALTCTAPGANGLGLSEFLESDAVADPILERYARHLDTADRRPVATTWALAYFTALLPPVVAAATLLHHVLPISVRQIVITLDSDGGPTHFHIPDEGIALPSANTASRYSTLLWEHLDQLIARLAVWGGVSRRLLWGNAARRFEDTLDQLDMLAGAQPAIRENIQSDRDALLTQPTWVERRNPLFMRARHVDQWREDRSRALRLHRQCCLSYLLPGEDYCQPCPLAPHNNSNGQVLRSP